MAYHGLMVFEISELTNQSYQTHQHHQYHHHSTSTSSQDCTSRKGDKKGKVWASIQLQLSSTCLNILPYFFKKKLQLESFQISTRHHSSHLRLISDILWHNPSHSHCFSILLFSSFLLRGKGGANTGLWKHPFLGFIACRRCARRARNTTITFCCSTCAVVGLCSTRKPFGTRTAFRLFHTHTEGKNTSADITNICAKKIEFPGMNIEILLETCAKSWSLILWDLFEKTTIICKILQRVNMAFWFALWRLACRWFEQFSQMFVSESRPWDKGSKSEFIPMSRLDLVEPCQSRPQVDYNNPNVNWDNSSWDLRLPPFFASLPKGTKEVTQAQREKWMFGHPKPC